MISATRYVLSTHCSAPEFSVSMSQKRAFTFTSRMLWKLKFYLTIFLIMSFKVFKLFRDHFMKSTNKNTKSEIERITPLKYELLSLVTAKEIMLRALVVASVSTNHRQVDERTAITFVVCSFILR